MSGSQPRPDLDAQIAHPRPHRTRGTQMQNARGTGVALRSVASGRRAYRFGDLGHSNQAQAVRCTRAVLATGWQPAGPPGSFVGTGHSDGPIASSLGREAHAVARRFRRHPIERPIDGAGLHEGNGSGGGTPADFGAIVARDTAPIDKRAGGDAVTPTDPDGGVASIRSVGYRMIDTSDARDAAAHARLVWRTGRFAHRTNSYDPADKAALRRPVEPEQVRTVASAAQPHHLVCDSHHEAASARWPARLLV